MLVVSSVLIIALLAGCGSNVKNEKIQVENKSSEALQILRTKMQKIQTRRMLPIKLTLKNLTMIVS